MATRGKKPKGGTMAGPGAGWVPAAEAPALRQRVEVSNPSDGGFIFWLARYNAFGLLCLVGISALVAAAGYVYFAATVPTIPDFAAYTRQAAQTTVVRAWDGTPLAEWAKEHRAILPFEALPKKLVESFIAAEDRRFFDHEGLDVRGLLRAALANMRAGGVSQGGSTITQQVAKSFLSPERTFQRKIREAILARRLEERYSKQEILALYLNQIFLGNGAYGVGAASRRIFDKDVSELDLGEMAMLAGLAQAPSRLAPGSNPEAARARRDYVLSAMVSSGFIKEEEAHAARAQPVRAHPRVDFFRDRAPHFAENVRREVARRFGVAKLWEGGLEVETTLLPWMDAVAQENVDFSARKLDKRQGWRGPVARLSATATAEFRRRAALRYGKEPPAEGRLYLGLVEAAQGGDYKVRVGAGTFDLPGRNMTWAYPYSVKDSTNGKVLESTAGVLKVGDVVWVKSAHQSRLRRFSDWTFDDKNEIAFKAPFDKRPPPKHPDLVLEQTPRPQGVLYTYDHGSGYVLAMVGGNDYDRSEFNRVVQACRQPGSTYKPIYYSLALDRGYGYGSLLNDVPKAEVNPITGEVWTPTNLNNTVEYQVTLEYSLVWSKNVPSVQLFKLVGAREVEAWARKLAFSTPIIADQALALGASCTRVDELTRAFSVFARNGVMVDPVVIRRVRDRDGRVIEDHTDLGDAMGTPADRLDRVVALAGRKTEPVIPPRTAWLTSQLLRRVVTRGHAPAIRNANLLVAGKTGTSSATMDAWFVGYTSRWMTTAWLGDDLRERPLGFKDAAFMLTVPMVARYLSEVGAGYPVKEVPWEKPAGVKKDDTGGTLRSTMDEVLEAEKNPKKQTPE